MKKPINLPARMRAKKNSSGRVYYYYDTCAKPRKWLALGADFLEALKRYADYEIEYNEKEMAERINRLATFGLVADRYVKEKLPAKAPRTQRDYLTQLNFLREFFDSRDNPAPINDITTVDIYEYLQWRKNAPVRANREVSLFSVIFNWARNWGYTNNANPCAGVEKHAEFGREVYVSHAVFWRVHAAAEPHVQFMMLMAYLTGQRVADTIKMKVADIHDNELWIRQNKTGAKVRIKIQGELAMLIEMALQWRADAVCDNLFVKNGRPVSYAMLNGGIRRAREKAGVKGTAEDFEFRDLRAKAATDVDDAVDIEAARKLLGHTTQKMTVNYIRRRKGALVEPAAMAGKK